MPGEWSFNGVTFDLGYQNRASPTWMPEIEATDRRLLGTSRFERTWRSTRWVLKAECLIESGTDGDTAYTTLRDAYAQTTIASMSDGVTTWQALIIDFAVVPLYNGTDGYRGAITFARPEG